MLPVLWQADSWPSFGLLEGLLPLASALLVLRFPVMMRDGLSHGLSIRDASARVNEAFRQDQRNVIRTGDERARG